MAGAAIEGGGELGLKVGVEGCGFGVVDQVKVTVGREAERLASGACRHFKSRRVFGGPTFIPLRSHRWRTAQDPTEFATIEAVKL